MTSTYAVPMPAAFDLNQWTLQPGPYDLNRAAVWSPMIHQRSCWHQPFELHGDNWLHDVPAVLVQAAFREQSQPQYRGSATRTIFFCEHCAVVRPVNRQHGRTWHDPVDEIPIPLVEN